MLQKKKWGWWAGILHCSILVVDGTFWTLIRLADRDRILYSGVMMLGIGLYGLIAMLKPTVREHFGT